MGTPSSALTISAAAIMDSLEPESFISAIMSGWRSSPTLVNVSFLKSSQAVLMAAASASSESVSAMAVGLWNRSSCRNMTVSCPTCTELASGPILTSRWGGAEASPNSSFALASSRGHSSSVTLPAATFMANAKHVGTPHSLQFSFGSFL